ncbi:alkaline phosphatase D family protein [Actinocorallia sp. A-T 12471]|uniref:alkaline phosphatase D family protein n=1 Tax=Actinocorallia sp. A-T 12471 TaxID=3089813 RepID=UPI0029CE4BF2|nr:alkaline phosphatase D family protein [Actinocorallia sp. A-T 12471]MDX6739269.1 alkaline phosphatase D family protein [Actinocorallia sp. A-T 12471]
MTHLNRRDALKLGGTGAALALMAPAAASAAPSPLFAHGVASGDPLPDGVILWTRVTPTPEAVPGSGAGPQIQVSWQIAEDAAFATVAASGVFATGPERDHTVKVDVRGLRPGADYHYRFTYAGTHSPTGRTRTAPASGASVDALRFGVASCSNWEAGFFSAYRHLAARDDLFGVIHLGDYIYEYGTGGYSAGGSVVRETAPAHEIVTLADYRIRHASYKTDPDLQAAHARHPWLIVWDDHEVANDAWADGAENHSPDTEGAYAARKAASHQAYQEWMPVRFSPEGVLYRSLRFGDLAEIVLLDLRSYRSLQAGGLAVDDPARTITGAPQMAWLKDTLAASTARWRIVGTSVMISPLVLASLTAEALGPLAALLGLPSGGVSLNPDQWDGYTADRAALLSALTARGAGDTVFLTGDIHTSWANEVPLKAGTYPLSPSVATEFVVPSVTSDNIDDILRARPRTTSLAVEAAIGVTNRHVRWTNMDDHGFGVVEIGRAQTRMDWYFLSDRKNPAATARKAVSYVTAHGTAKLKRVFG